MAARGTRKWLSRQQEDRIARYYNGKVSASSGAAVTDAGDVRTATELIECKLTGSFLKPAKSITVKLSDLEKIADEAWAEGKDPVVALCIYNPDSVLADANGYIDLTLRLTSDDIGR